MRISIVSYLSLLGFLVVPTIKCVFSSKEESVSPEEQLIELKEELRKASLVATESITKRKQILEAIKFAREWVNGISIGPNKSIDKGMENVRALEKEISVSLKKTYLKIRPIYRDTNVLIQRITGISNGNINNDDILEVIKEAKEVLSRDRTTLWELKREYRTFLQRFEALESIAVPFGLRIPNDSFRHYSGDENDIPYGKRTNISGGNNGKRHGLSKDPEEHGLKFTFLNTKRIPKFTKSQLFSTCMLLKSIYSKILHKINAERTKITKCFQDAKGSVQKADKLLEEASEFINPEINLKHAKINEIFQIIEKLYHSLTADIDKTRVNPEKYISLLDKCVDAVQGIKDDEIVENREELLDTKILREMLANIDTLRTTARGICSDAFLIYLKCTSIDSLVYIMEMRVGTAKDKKYHKEYMNELSDDKKVPKCGKEKDKIYTMPQKNPTILNFEGDGVLCYETYASIALTTLVIWIQS